MRSAHNRRISGSNPLRATIHTLGDGRRWCYERRLYWFDSNRGCQSHPGRWTEQALRRHAASVRIAPRVPFIAFQALAAERGLGKDEVRVAIPRVGTTYAR